MSNPTKKIVWLYGARTLTDVGVVHNGDVVELSVDRADKFIKTGLAKEFDKPTKTKGKGE